MKIAIFESLTTSGGHEVEFDRVLVEELRALGHAVAFYVPQNFGFSFDYKVPVHRLAGKSVSYTGMHGWKKIFYTIRREWNRQRWFTQLYELAHSGEFDALIVPTSTYRYLRALHINKLRRSPVPVLFIMHGINLGEAPRFWAEVKKITSYPNIKPTVLTLGDSLFGQTSPQVFCVRPATLLPREIDVPPAQKVDPHKPLILGFFGQYRREKKLEAFLEAFVQGTYTRPVKLLVQGATTKPEDGADFERIVKKYAGHENIEFIYQGLIGRQWEEAIAGVDALLLPFSAPRYRYHWGGMLFTALGYQKPVIVSDEMNPEVTAAYEIGMTFPTGDSKALLHTVQQFINTFPLKEETYRRELERAYADYHPRLFGRRLVAIMQGDPQP